MTKLVRVVLDTNVYLSAIAFGGMPRRVLDLAMEGSVSVYVTPAILLEIADKLQNKFRWSKEDVEKVIKGIAEMTKMVMPKVSLAVVRDDPSDDKIIECAYESRANYIVTGDKHLLKIKKWKRITILTPTDFWLLWQKKGGD